MRMITADVVSSPEVDGNLTPLFFSYASFFTRLSLITLKLQVRSHPMSRIEITSCLPGDHKPEGNIVGSLLDGLEDASVYLGITH